VREIVRRERESKRDRDREEKRERERKERESITVLFNPSINQPFSE
jgi:hypothetical protein